MARRIEIELTSARPDGTWTWRAAGALNPRGTVDASLLYETAKAGDVVRAEAEFGIDGITVVSVEPPRPPETVDPNRIELIERPASGGVTTQLTGGGRLRPDGGSDRRRGDQSAQHRGRSSPRPAPNGPGGGPSPANGNGRGARVTDGAAGSGQGHAGRTERQPRSDRPSRQPRATAGPGRSGPRGSGPREAQEGADGQRTTGPRGEGGQGARKREESPRQKRLSPGNAHRNAMLESLPAEQQPIAQQLLRGGIPAVRTALHFERERAREEGRPEPSTEGVLALAESLVSRVKAAEWRDRADAAIKLGDDLAMRDLRSLVSGSDAARDEASRDLVVTLREMLERRIEAHRTAWSEEVAKNLDDGHVVRALRLSSRPPDPAARFSAELATRLRDAASTALSPATPEAQWLAALQAVVESPVRRTVRPEGLPANPSPELLETARQHCGRVPALAPLLGISVPPPPGPVRPNVPTKAPLRSHGRPSRPVRHGAKPATPGGPRPHRPVGEPVPTSGDNQPSDERSAITGEGPVPEAAASSLEAAPGPEAAAGPEAAPGPEPAPGPEAAPGPIGQADGGLAHEPQPGTADEAGTSEGTGPAEPPEVQSEASGGAAAESQSAPEADAAEIEAADQTGAETQPEAETDAATTGADEAVPPTGVTSGAGASRVGEP